MTTRDQTAAATNATPPAGPATPAAPDSLVTLPHSGLRVPDPLVRVTSLKQLPTFDGVAFQAVLRRGKIRIGMIGNDGRGGETYFTPDDHKAFGYHEINDFAGACLDRHGEPCSTEHVLNDLIEEYDTGRTVNRDTGKQRTTVRRLAPLFEGSSTIYMTELGHLTGPAGPEHRAEIARAVYRSRPPQPGAWWQVWTGTAWEDLPDTDAPEAPTAG